MSVFLIFGFIILAWSQPACNNYVKPSGYCGVKSTAVQQHTSLGITCQQIDSNLNIPLTADAQACLQANPSSSCNNTITKMACAHYCQPCLNSDTIVLNTYCQPLCDAINANCGACADRIILSFGGPSYCVNQNEFACAAYVDGTSLPSPLVTAPLTLLTTNAPTVTDSYALAVNLPGLLIGLGLGLPLAAIVALFIILRGRERIEPHSEEDAGPSHWVGTTKPTIESVAAADAAFARGRAKAGDEETSTLDLESEEDDKPKAGKGAAKKEEPKKKAEPKKDEKTTEAKKDGKADTKKEVKPDAKKDDKADAKKDEKADVKKDEKAEKAKASAKKSESSSEETSDETSDETSSGSYEYEYVTETESEEKTKPAKKEEKGEKKEEKDAKKKK